MGVYLKIVQQSSYFVSDTSCATVTATDADATNPNNIVTYSIEGRFNHLYYDMLLVKRLR